MKIGISNDHVAVDLKNVIKNYIENNYQYQVIDYGTNSTHRTDYPIYGEKIARAVINKEVDLGIAICGTGVGISIAANKVKGIRCACVSEPYSAKLSKEHNNTNILAFGSRVVGSELAKMIVDSWLNAQFLGERHQKRIDIISKIEGE